MADRVAFTLIYNFRNPPSWVRPWREHYEAVLDQMVWLDRHVPGIDGVHTTEHHFYDDGYLPSPLVMAGGIASVTERLSIGTQILQFPLHHPVRVAEDSLLLDIMSAGRFVLGLGLGYAEEEFAGLGVSLGSRRTRLIEGVSILRQAFAGRDVVCDGEIFKIPPTRVMPPPIRPGGPPIWFGAHRPVAIERAARLADGFYAGSEQDAAIFLQACEQISRPVEERRFGRTYWTLISADPERTLDEVGHHMLHRLNEYIRRGAFPGAAPYDDPRAAVRDGHCLLLDGAGAIREFGAAIAQGAAELTITPVMPGEPLDGAAERIQFLADAVIPKLRSCTNHSRAPSASGSN